MITILISRSQPTGEFEASYQVPNLPYVIKGYGKTIPQSIDAFFDKWRDVFTDRITEWNWKSAPKFWL